VIVATAVDTAVFAYALGGEHPMRAAARRLLELARDQKLHLHASVEMVQEIAFHRMRRTDRSRALEEAQDIAQLCYLHDYTAVVLSSGLALMATHEHLRGRDAVHAATVFEAGIPTFVSPDHAFDGIPGIERLDIATAVERFQP